MPIYQFTNLRTGKLEEHFRSIERRDCVEPHLKRITVPATIGYANHSGLREPGADVSVPAAFRQYEEQGKSVKQIEKETGFSREHIRKVWDF